MRARTTGIQLPKPHNIVGLGELHQCAHCHHITNKCDWQADGCCYNCRRKGVGLLDYMVRQSSPRWRKLEKGLKLDAGTV